LFEIINFARLLANTALLQRLVELFMIQYLIAYIRRPIHASSALIFGEE